jgi:flagellin-specific chaperone FliS
LNEIEDIISEIKRSIIRLYFASPESDDIEAKQKVVDILLEIINDELVNSFNYEEGAILLKNYISNKVEELFG